MSCFSNIEQQHPRENFATEFLGDISLIISEDTVEKITETRITQNNERLYKVCWKDSWILEDQLKEHCQELIKAFWRCVPNGQEIEQNYNLPCFGRTFSNGLSVGNQVNATDMFSELVFTEENQDVSQQHPQQILHNLVVLPMKDKQSEVLDRSNDTALSHLTPQEMLQNPVVNDILTIEDTTSFCLPVEQTTVGLNENSTYIESKELNFELEIEEQSDDEPDGEGITFYSNFPDIVKSCTKCTAEFQTKCKQCSTCLQCRPNAKHHFHNCKGEKVCTVCDHCFSTDKCMMCCPYCGQVYPTTMHWKRHVRITHLATSNKPESKKKIPKKSNDESNTMATIATNIKRWECSTCGKEFLKQHKLKRHEKIHNDVKEFHCHVCSKRFVQKVHLQKHLLQHGIGEKRFKCHTCDKWFNHKVSLKSHVLKCKIQN